MRLQRSISGNLYLLKQVLKPEKEDHPLIPESTSQQQILTILPLEKYLLVRVLPKPLLRLIQKRSQCLHPSQIQLLICLAPRLSKNVRFVLLILRQKVLVPRVSQTHQRLPSETRQIWLNKQLRDRVREVRQSGVTTALEPVQHDQSLVRKSRKQQVRHIVAAQQSHVVFVHQILNVLELELHTNQVSANIYIFISINAEEDYQILPSTQAFCHF